MRSHSIQFNSFVARGTPSSLDPRRNAVVPCHIARRSSASIRRSAAVPLLVGDADVVPARIGGGRTPAHQTNRSVARLDKDDGAHNPRFRCCSLRPFLTTDRIFGSTGAEARHVAGVSTVDSFGGHLGPPRAPPFGSGVAQIQWASSTILFETSSIKKTAKN